MWHVTAHVVSQLTKSTAQAEAGGVKGQAENREKKEGEAKDYPRQRKNIHLIHGVSILFLRQIGFYDGTQRYSDESNFQVTRENMVRR